MAVEGNEADAYAGDDTPTNSGLMLLWYPRATGLVTFLSALCMLRMAWKRRNLLFHRLVLGKKTKQETKRRSHASHRIVRKQ